MRIDESVMRFRAKSWSLNWNRLTLYTVGTKGATGMGKGALVPGNVEKCVFWLQMLLATSVDEVFMHNFEKMS